MGLRLPMSLVRRANWLYGRIALFAVFMLAAAGSFQGYYQKWHFAEADVAGDHSRAAFESMVDGTAWRPYVYRQLLPTIANRIDMLVPEETKHQLFERQVAGDDPILSAISASPTANNEVYFFRYLVLYLLTFASAIGAVCAMYLVCTTLDFAPATAAFAAIALILLVPIFQSDGGFFYDYPELAFMALAVWIALRFDWWWLLPIAALGAWNKESFLIYIPTLYPLLHRRNPKSALPATAVLSVVCGAIYLYMRSHFAHNPGGSAEVWLVEHGRYLLDWHKWLFATEETYGVRLPRVYTLIPMTLIITTVWRAWKYLPTAIKRHAQVAAAINIPLYLLFSYPGELRDLSLLYIAFLVCIAANAKAVIKDAYSTIRATTS